MYKIRNVSKSLVFTIIHASLVAPNASETASCWSWQSLVTVEYYIIHGSFLFQNELVKHKTEHHDITEITVPVAFNTISQPAS